MAWERWGGGAGGRGATGRRPTRYAAAGQGDACLVGGLGAPRNSPSTRLNAMKCSSITPWAAPLMTTSSAVGMIGSSLSPRVRMSWLPTTTRSGRCRRAARSALVDADAVDLGGERPAEPPNPSGPSQPITGSSWRTSASITPAGGLAGHRADPVGGGLVGPAWAAPSHTNRPPDLQTSVERMLPALDGTVRRSAAHRAPATRRAPRSSARHASHIPLERVRPCGLSLRPAPRLSSAITR